LKLRLSRLHLDSLYLYGVLCDIFANTGTRHYSAGDTWGHSSNIGPYYAAVEDGSFYGRPPYHALLSSRDLLVSLLTFFSLRLERVKYVCVALCGSHRIAMKLHLPYWIMQFCLPPVTGGHAFTKNSRIV